MEEELDGFQVPVCQGLVKPITILGISREAMILNVATATAISSFFTGKPPSKIFCYSSVCQMVVPSCC